MKKSSLQFVFALLHFTFYILYFAFSLQAQTPPSYSSADIYLQIKKLNVLGSVLYIAAHPDDENTRLLAYFSKEKLYRTGYLSLTRGDGGQNLIGDEQGIELGLIRTQELLSARRMDGAEQFFSRAYDFGFCKTADEALKTWGHDKILSDVVWVIRKFQPDVIITRFPGDERAGHGPKNSLMDGVDTTWTRVKAYKQYQVALHTALNEKNETSLKHSIDNISKLHDTKLDRDIALIQKKINGIINNYNFEHPEYSVDSLVSVYKLIQ